MTSLLEPSFVEEAGEAVGDWHPTRYTPPLSEDFTTEGDKLLRFAGRFWRIAEVLGFVVFDEWQRWLVRHVLETYPQDWPVEHLRGELRFRQVVISMGRQNGKSLLGALFVIYFLALHVRGPRVIGLASVDRQAKIVYDRVKYGIDNEPQLEREIKTTETRGITRRDGSGLYQTLPAKEESAQGEPATGVLYDELHLGLSSLWDAMVLAQRARRNSLMVGITTAGDDNSKLLLRLYDEGEAAIAGHDERFGFFLWEAGEEALLEHAAGRVSPAGVIAANPSIACGRVSLEVALSDARKMMKDLRRGPDGLTGPQRVRRYTLNRFIEGAANAWASVTAWKDAGRDVAEVTEALEGAEGIVYGLERTPEWEWASITATTRTTAGYVTELVASLEAPDHDRLLEACRALARAGGRPAFAGDSSTLAGVLDALKDDGVEAWKLTAAEMVQVAAHGKAAIARRQVAHPADPLVRVQLAGAKPRTGGDAGERLSRSLSAGHIDAVLATAVGLYVAAVREDTGLQMW